LLRSGDCAIKSLDCFLGPPGKHIAGGLKSKHEAVQTLQQSIVQFPRNASPLAEARPQRRIELPRQMSQAKLIHRPRQEEKSTDAGSSKPNRLKPGRSNAEIQRGAFFVPSTIVIAGDYPKPVVSGPKIVIKGLAPRPGFSPVLIMTLKFVAEEHLSWNLETQRCVI